MAVSQPNVTISLALDAEQDDVLLYDATGTYNASTNPGGYGLPTGPAVNDVTDVTITVSPQYLATTLVYVFEVASGTITAATLSIGGGTAENILSSLPSTVWPFASADPFRLFKTYVTAPPTLQDDVIKVDYQIEGEVSAEAFDFTTTAFLVRTTDLELCVTERIAAIDPSCGCDDSGYTTAMYMKMLLFKIEDAASYGDLQAALDSFAELTRYCEDSECGC